MSNRYEQAIEQVRAASALGVGWFVGPDHPHTPLGGPMSTREIAQAVELLNALRDAGLPAPHVYILAREEGKSFVSLEWGSDDKGDPFVTWDIDVTHGASGWEVHGMQFMGHADISTIEMGRLSIKGVVHVVTMLRDYNADNASEVVR